MKVFLAGIIQGSLTDLRIHDQDWRQPIKEALARHLPEADVYCHYATHPQSITYELPEILETLADGNRRAAEAGVVVCWLPQASMGTALEMFVAHQAGAVVLSITPLAANWVIRAYSDRIFPSIKEFEQFLAAGELPALLARKRENHPK